MVTYRNRQAAQIENELLQVTATREGGHIAEILHKPSGANPLWTPNWPSIEPSSYSPAKHPEYGPGAEAHLLSGIMGHNICLDVFGAPGAEEMSVGIPIHGEAGFAVYEIAEGGDWMEFAATLDKAQLRFKRRIAVSEGSSTVAIREEVENLASVDRPIAWTQHVTLGAPFLRNGSTEFNISATKSKVGDASFNDGRGGQVPDAEFEWPWCPMKDGSVQDLRVFPRESGTGGFTAHLMNQQKPQAWFVARSPETNVLCGYLWDTIDFPWLARWEENRLRTQPPWNGEAVTCGMEFGVSPMVESRRDMVKRGQLFGVPTYCWLPARSVRVVEYCAFILHSTTMPSTVERDSRGEVKIS